MLLVDIQKFKISGGYIEQYQPKDMQFTIRRYDRYFKLFFGKYPYRPQAFRTICDTRFYYSPYRPM